MERKVVSFLDITFDFEATPPVMKRAKDLNLKVLLQEFTDKTCMKPEVPLRIKDRALERLSLLRATGSRVEWL